MRIILLGESWTMTNTLLDEVVLSKLGGTPDYFPLEQGVYEVTPGLFPLHHDFGNGKLDRQMLQIDPHYHYYIQQKQAARSERLEKYFQQYEFDDLSQQAVTKFLLERVQQEYPVEFSITHDPAGNIHLKNTLTGVCLTLDQACILFEQQQSNTDATPYINSFDALASQLQEDLAVVKVQDDGDNYLSAIHLCFPNHWAAEEKIGVNFSAIHDPVPHIEKINRNAPKLLRGVLNKGPFVRFAWGISSDTRLNHHPKPPPGVAVNLWRGRAFNPDHPRAYLRVERQVVWGLPLVDSLIFSIRTYFQDLTELKKNPERRGKLISAIDSMSPQSLRYKGIGGAEDKAYLLAWLNQQ